MPVKRGADGNIVEEKTKISDTFQQVTRVLPGQPGAGDTVGADTDGKAASEQQPGYDARTVLAGSTRRAKQERDKAPRTRIYRPGRTERGAPAAAPGAGTRAVQSPAMEDPPVGWLVVIKGPGQGNFAAIGIGSNSVGRDESERIRIDFGDEIISRRGHSTITYDPRGKKFYLQHGVGKNLTYLDGDPVLAPTELVGFSRITIGNTELLFVPLCCDQFDWEDHA